MIIKKLVWSAVIVSALISTVSADLITLHDVTFFTATGTNSVEDYIAHGTGDVNYLEGRVGDVSDFVTWNHQFTFDPPAERILDASLTISFTDDSDPSSIKTEHGKLMFEGGNWHTIFEAELNGSWDREVSVAGSDVQDGIFEVSIKNHNARNGFFLTRSELTVVYSDVPEPGTIIMMVFGGLSMLGFAASRKPRSK